MTNKNNNEKLVFSKTKLILFGWTLFFMKRKAKKMVRKNTKYPDTYNEAYTYKWIKKVVRRILFLANIKIEVEGYENWIDKGLVITSNHQSNLDALILLALNDFSKQQPIGFIAKQELWTHKTFSSFVKLIDCIPLDRKNPRSALDAFSIAKELIIEYKRGIVIFPEGTRSNSNDLGEFQPAAFKVAHMSNAHILPITIIGSYKAFRENRDKTVVVKVIFDKPIPPTKHLEIKTELLSNIVKNKIEKNLKLWNNKQPSQQLKRKKVVDIKTK